MKKGLLLIILFLIIKSSFGQQFTEFKGDYLGQTPPGNKAVKFAPGIISLSNRHEILITFTPDGNECYIDCYIGDSSKIYYTKRVNNTWTEQVEAPFSLGQNVVLSSLSTNGNRLFFETFSGIWKVERTKSGWVKPQLLPLPITSDDHSYYETADGVAYFGSKRPGGLGKKLEIWRVSCKDDHYQKAENLGPIINCTKRNLTPCIAPDESYLIYTQSDGTYEHLYISFNKRNGEWTVPVNMDRNGENINRRFQNRPTLSPDGKYLFFNMHDPSTKEGDIYWVSTSIIDSLKNITRLNEK
jgi:hypothetical protein